MATVPAGAKYISNPNDLKKYSESQLLRINGKIYLKPQTTSVAPVAGVPAGAKYISDPKELSKYREDQLLRIGGKIYLKPQGATSTPVGTNPVAGGLPPDVQSIIDQYANQLKNQPAAPKPFDQSGFYNEADATAQGQAEYNPYFQKLLQKDYGYLTSNYADRGLLNSGGYMASQATAKDENNQGLQSAIAGYKTNAYQNAWQKYINSLQQY